MNILLVCTGNTCRSSMAEGIFKYMLKDARNMRISSAGISAFEGDKANEKSISVLKKKGIDISNHRARQLTIHMIQDADLILTMTYSHKKLIKDYILKNLGDASLGNKVFTLKEYAYLINDEIISENCNLDIADPFGMDYSVYEQTMIEIEKEIQKIINNMNDRGAIGSDR